MATKRKENADRMKALDEEIRKGKKPAKKSAFDEADKDGDGKLSKKELKAAKKKIVENDEE